MPRASDLRALAELERRLAALRPPAPDLGDWIKSTSNSELDALEEIYRRAAGERRELTAADRADVTAIQAAAVARMIKDLEETTAGASVS